MSRPALYAATGTIVLLLIAGIAAGALSWTLPLWTALGSLIVWLGGKAYEEFAARLAQRRTFVQQTTTRVVDLAWTHYWALANAAGTLGGTLQTYLRGIEAHLLLRYDSPQAMQVRFAELAREAADQSWPTLIRLIMLFHRFQFRGSNTYLLPNHQSGETLRRLYNSLVAALPQESFIADIRIEIERALAARPGADKAATGTLELDQLDVLLEEPGLAEALTKPRDAWQRWFANALARVDTAAEAAETFELLVTRELVQLNAAFFEDRSIAGTAPSPPFAIRSAAAGWAAERWPGLLERHHLLAIERAQSLPRSFAPLGARKPPVKAPPAQPQSAAEPAAAADEQKTGTKNVEGAQ